MDTGTSHHGSVKRAAGEEFLQKLHETYSFLLERYNGVIVDESWDKHGCTMTIQVNGSRFHFVWDERDGPNVRIHVLLGCPDAQSPLNQWQSPFPILNFIADLKGEPRPLSVLYSLRPEALERIVEFFRNPAYSRWCAKYIEWYQQWRQELDQKSAHER